ncbi:putative PIN domain protein [Bifidobacterium actinocoloniiforme DSM 22766]|uniref:Putative PIN domain protein n=1 Tax=Bifidobacterium actinocoloniiforme DSM 22766 TaxID=1437605 RepID=A0A086YWG1_9BIFI|nr:DUF4411 family protein [Bifidobacterium actinocoloniiforme]AKV55807.1 hypothetical protein AB656_06135 [Bifidobacterium actinocoloniiforme DSM 22766]KFI38611.1 putative PIN domain protein [Bifidobacterium actinocoloniiforme DSM 22766]
MARLYLLDSNVLIDSHRQHHPFMYQEFHPFWRWMERLAGRDEVKLLDVVYKELTIQDTHHDVDELGAWVEYVFAGRVVSHKTSEMGAAYARVQDYLVRCGSYTRDSIREWEPEDKADPWLIAAGMVTGAAIVTNEVSAHPSRNQRQKREPKIPDVARAFGVETMNLRAFYDANGRLIRGDYPIQGQMAL